MSRKKIFKGTAVLAGSEIVCYGMSLVRNMILARVLTKADFGLAAAFAMILGVLELSSKMGIPTLVIQDNDGDKKGFISTAHSFRLFSALIGAVLLLFIEPLAKLFGLEGHTIAFFCLAMVAVIQGLEHLDVRRYQRHMKFGPIAIVNALPQIIVTIAAWPVAKYFNDYRAVLVLLLAKTIGSTVLSHLFAENRYSIKWDKTYMKRAFSFCWPLLLSGSLMFFVFNGGQSIVGFLYGAETLAPYAAAAALAMVPAMIYSRIVNNLLLPVFASNKNLGRDGFVEKYRGIIHGMFFLTAITTLGMVLASEQIMQTVYSTKYANSGYLFALLSVANGIRFLRVLPNVASMSMGDSKIPLYSSIGRVSSLVPALILASMGHSLWVIAAFEIVGELIACAVAFILLKKRREVPIFLNFIPLASLLGLTAIAAVISESIIKEWSKFGAFGITIVLMLIFVAACVFLSPQLKAEFDKILTKLPSRN